MNGDDNPVGEARGLGRGSPRTVARHYVGDLVYGAKSLTLEVFTFTPSVAILELSTLV